MRVRTGSFWRVEYVDCMRTSSKRGRGVRGYIYDGMRLTGLDKERSEKCLTYPPALIARPLLLRQPCCKKNLQTSSALPGHVGFQSIKPSEHEHELRNTRSVC